MTELRKAEHRTLVIPPHHPVTVLAENLHALADRVEQIEGSPGPAELADMRACLGRAVQSADMIADQLLLSEEELRSQLQRLDDTQAAFDTATRTLAVEQRYYRDLFEFAPDPYIVTDPGGAMLLVNHAAARLLHRSEGSLSGDHLATLVPAQDTTAFRRLLAEARQIGRVAERMLRLKPLRQPPVDILATVTAVRAGPDPQAGQQPTRTSDIRSRAHRAPDDLSQPRAGDVVALRWSLRDVTASMRDARQIERLQSLTSALSEAITPAQVADAVVTHGTAALGAARGALTEVAAGKDTCTIYRQLDAGALTVRSTAESLPLDASHPVTDAIRTRAPTFLSTRDARRARYPAAPLAAVPDQSEALAAVPLEVHGRVLGVLLVTFPESCTFSPEERAFALTLARQCAQALDRARLYELSEQARRQAETAWKRAESARTVAEEASRSKSEFVAAMSHELRTPINVILGYADLLQAGVPTYSPEIAREQAGRIRSAGEHLLGLVEQVLTTARIGAAREFVSRERVDLSVLVRDMVALAEPLAVAKQLELVLRVPDTPLEIETDVGKVRQILYNLLANALKFTQQGEISIVVRGEQDGSCIPRVILEVSDTGSGIAPEHLESVFDAFWQVEREQSPLYRAALPPREDEAPLSGAAPADGRGGTGLGLSISRDLAHLLGGELRVRSTLREGSTFTLELPAFAPATTEAE